MVAVKRNRKAKSKDAWKLESKDVRVEYLFDTVEDSPFLCTVIVINGVVSSYSGVFALDAEIVHKLESDGVDVPANCLGPQWLVEVVDSQGISQWRIAR